MCTSTPFSYKSKLGSVWIDFSSSRPYTNRQQTSSPVVGALLLMCMYERHQESSIKLPTSTTSTSSLKYFTCKKKKDVHHKGVCKSMIGNKLCAFLPEGKTAQNQYTLAQTTDKRHTCRDKLFTQQVYKAECWKQKLYKWLPRSSKIDACQAFSCMLFELYHGVYN